MKRHASCIIAFAGFLILAASAHAETTYRFELYGSGNFPIDKSFEVGPPQSTAILKGEHQFSPGVRGGVRFGVDGSGHWGQDISYSYGRNATKIVGIPNGDFAFTHRTHQFAYNAVLYPGGLQRGKKLYPYITAGAGGTIFTLAQSTINEGMNRGMGKLETHTSFTFNVGGGARYQFGNCGIRFDVRDWMSHPPRYGIGAESNDPNAFVFPVNGVFQQIEFSIGFVYQFGSKF
jgi:opacity protein-like surface antigen